ncbi:hypothetical protein CFC21_067859 [Triticum aestivum]|uniref:F-box domain-containing protein n=2 Tax=Triticum aestivum TaxID=4565 RepID=A0A9R1H841_WHEAT|nr:uncharacterized protein LOC123105171 [Triticum aestivum]KAF7061131.1 hypothetical protein CFC21_067852 [Triticum aestivum]KAF7061137.1 hypothetical protein CFC21_067859 [Triticum aestivum]
MKTYHGVSPGGRRRSGSQIGASEEAAEMAGASRSRRRSQIAVTRPGRRSRSHIGASEEDEGLVRPGRRRRSQVGASEDRRRRRRRTSPEAPVPLPGDGDTPRNGGRCPPAPCESLPLDMLWEILLLLPPQPSSRLLASLVSRRWRGLATDPNFVRQFQARRRSWKPPLLGFFERRRKIVFNQDILYPPDRVPAERIHIPFGMASRGFEVLGCRGGRVLALHRVFRQLIVFAPITGEQRYFAVPAEFGQPSILYGAVLCAAGEQDHVHGHCHCSPFKVVLVSHKRDHQPQACVFSSETDTWSNIISTKYPCELHGDSVPATLIGDALYWLLSCNAIFWFDLDMQSLAVIMGPPGMNESGNYRIIKPEDGADGLAIAIFLFPNLQIWQRVVNSQGIATWFLRKTVEMHSTLGIPHQIRRKVWQDKVLGYDEDNDVIILYVDDSAYMLELKQMQSRKLNGTRSMKQCHPFTSFYPPDIAI